MDASEIAPKIRAFLEEINVRVESDDDDLFAVGDMDSGGVVELVMFLEETFDLTLDPGDIDMDHFGSVNRIAALAAARAAG